MYILLSYAYICMYIVYIRPKEVEHLLMLLLLLQVVYIGTHIIWRRPVPYTTYLRIRPMSKTGFVCTHIAGWQVRTLTHTHTYYIRVYAEKLQHRRRLGVKTRLSTIFKSRCLERKYQTERCSNIRTGSATTTEGKTIVHIILYVMQFGVHYKYT